MHIIKEVEIFKNSECKFGLKSCIDDKIILEPIYDSIQGCKTADELYLFSNQSYEEDDNDDFIEDDEDYDYDNIFKLFLITKDKKFGIADKTGILTPPTYDKIQADNNTLSMDKIIPVFAALKGDYWGYVDETGKALTNFIYKKVEYPLYSSIAKLYNKNGMVEYFSLTSDKVIYSHKQTEDVSSNITQNELCLIIEGNRYKVLDTYGNVITEFSNNPRLNSARIRYLNEKLLMYYVETKVSDAYYKMGLVDYQGNVLTELKYCSINTIAGTNSIIATNIVGQISELVNEKGKVIKSQMKYFDSDNGYDDEGRIIPPIYYVDVNNPKKPIKDKVYIEEKLLHICN